MSGEGEGRAGTVETPGAEISWATAELKFFFHAGRFVALLLTCTMHGAHTTTAVLALKQ